MVWFRVDDVLPFHARVLEAGNAAMGLWVRAGALSAGQLTDGFITAATARTLGSPKEIRRLVDVGLWLEVDGGYQFHAWAEDGTGTKRQPTRAEVESSRKAERDRKAAQRAGRKETQQDTPPRPPGVPVGQPAGHPPDDQGKSRHVSEDPVPSRPDPTLDSYVSPSSYVPEREATNDDDRSRRRHILAGLGVTDFDRILTAIARHVDRPLTEPEAVQIVMAILAKPKQHPRQPQAYVLSSIANSWAEIQQQLDEAAVAA